MIITYRVYNFNLNHMIYNNFLEKKRKKESCEGVIFFYIFYWGGGVGRGFGVVVLVCFKVRIGLNVTWDIKMWHDIKRSCPWEKNECVGGTKFLFKQLLNLLSLWFIVIARQLLKFFFFWFLHMDLTSSSYYYYYFIALLFLFFFWFLHGQNLDKLKFVFVVNVVAFFVDMYIIYVHVSLLGDGW